MTRGVVASPLRATFSRRAKAPGPLQPGQADATFCEKREATRASPTFRSNGRVSFGTAQDGPFARRGLRTGGNLPYLGRILT